ncbi:MAG: EF-hand domain-containing protein [Proteobacteria bacterium]|nr:EF-hand domain-containing protein [Pseudomonadota bacterium]
MTLIAMVILSSTTIVWAEKSKTETDDLPLINRFDQNGDSLISIEEFVGPEDHFSMLDTDGDGYITREEAHARRHRNVPEDETETDQQ